MTFKQCYTLYSLLSILIIFNCPYLRAQQSAEELAKKLSNPIAGLISVPLQNNIDYDIGQYHGSKYTLNFQPVVPIQLNQKLNLITRYIVPIVDQHDITGKGDSQLGLSDATISAFFTPANSKINI